MNFQEKQQEYARLIVENGAAIQKGQELVLRCPAECWEFGRMIVKAGYEAGAKEVIVHWGDDEVARLRYEYAPMEVFENVPKWRADSMNSYAENGAAFIAITAENPNAFKGVDREKQMAAAKANDKAMEPYYKRMVSSQVQWVVAAVPGKEWAKQVFPEKSEAQAMESLWEAIFCAVRIQDGDAVQAWREHDALLSEKCEILNKYQFAELHYENEAGTDFRVGLVKNHIWEGGSEESGSGVRFIANMPTEEVFTMPDYRKAEGKVVSSRPLSYRWNLIKDFSLTFHEGKVVDFDAREGYDALKQLLDTDEGSKSLGEVALVPYASPISEMGILFYNTLFDENASCHLALGECYPTTVQDGEKMNEEELHQIGGNHSINHVDFMIGTKDMKITGITEDGKEIPVFIDGSWAL